jgi:hypothetical protein
VHNATRLAILTLLLLARSAQAQTQAKPDVVDRGKKATVLVEVSTPRGDASGTGFCIDKSGLFITNAHVVEDAVRVRLVLDIGLKSQRNLSAKVLRADDEFDLALLKIDPDRGLTPLELGKADTLTLTEPLTTFGFPFGHLPAIARGVAPEVTVIRSRVTSLKMENAKLRFVQFDGQLNPGNSGGPVLDDGGQVVGVVVATVRGAAMNLAIPVRILSEFLTAPGLVFDPPPLAYKDRSQPVTWTIKVQPPTPVAKLPEGLSVVIKLATGPDDVRTATAVPVGGGVFRAKVIPVPRDPGRKVDLDIRFPGGGMYHVAVKDSDVRVGGARLMLSDLRMLFGEPSPRAFTARGQFFSGPILGLGKVKSKVGKKVVTIDLNEASQINVQPLGPPQPVQVVEALVEARQGGRVLASVHKRANLSGAPVIVVPVAPGVVAIVPVDPQPAPRGMMGGPPSYSDEGHVKIGGVLDVDGIPLGAGAAVRPPKAAMGGVRLTPEPASGGEVRRFVGHTGAIGEWRSRPTAAGSSPRATTTPSGSGTSRPAARSASSRDTPTTSRASPSCPTAAAASPGATTTPCGCGTSRPAASCACSAGTPPTSPRSPSRPTGPAPSPGPATARPGSGTWRPAASCRRSSGTRMPSRRSLSCPMAAGLCLRARTARSGSGTWRPAAS